MTAKRPLIVEHIWPVERIKHHNLYLERYEHPRPKSIFFKQKLLAVESVCPVAISAESVRVFP